MHFAPLRNHTSQDNILRYQLYQLRQFRDKNRFFESRGSVDILGKRKPDLIPVGRTFSNRQETRGFVGAGLARRAKPEEFVGAGLAPSLSKLGFRWRAERPVTLSWVPRQEPT